MGTARTLPSRREQLTLQRFPRLLTASAWGLLIYNIAPVILWGAVVRATGSGNGCGDHWPLCNGVFLQTNPRLATMIELIHRMSSGLAVLGVVAMLVWIFLATPRKHLARITIVAAAILTFNEALLGALLVLLGLTGDNVSVERAAYLSLHLANTLLLLAALTLSAYFLERGAGCLRGRLRFTRIVPAVVGLAAILAVGVSGSLAALGDTLFPATTLQGAFAQDFSGHTNWVLRLRLIHPLFAILAAAFVCWLLYRGAAHEAMPARRLARWAVLLLLLQIGLGVADVLFLAPVWLQVLHLLGADVLWVVLVVLAASICIPASPQEAGAALAARAAKSPAPVLPLA